MVKQFLLFAVLLLITSQINAFEHGITPAPRKVERSTGEIVVNSLSSIVLSPHASQQSKFAVARLQEEILNRTNISLNVVKSAQKNTGQFNIYIGNPDEDELLKELISDYNMKLTNNMRDEGYVLGIGDKGIVIGAYSDAGIIYGTTSLKQMIFNYYDDGSEKYVFLPKLKIHDWPAMQMRGIHDDIARGQVSTTENYKEIIRFLAEFKMNTLMIYFEDAFRFEQFPDIGRNRDALTKAKIDELEAYAKNYNVQIIPIFQLLDHHSQLLNIPQFNHLAEFPGSGSLRISDETYDFLDKCVKELSETFDSEFFHAGLDESWDLGTNASKDLVDSLGLAIVHANHYKKVHAILQKYGRRMMMYNRVSLEHPEIMDLIPKDIIHMYYSYSAKEHFQNIELAGENGFEMGIHPGMNNWQRFFPDLSEALVNIRNLTLEAAENNALGAAVCTWGDYGGKNFRELLYYGYAYQGEVAWSPETNNIDKFGTTFFNLRNGKGTATYFKTIYSLLEKWPADWNRGRTIIPYFRHPFLTNINGFVLDEKQKYLYQNNGKLALQLIHELQPKVKYRQSDLKYLDFCALTYLNFLKSEELVNDIQKEQNNNLTQDAEDLSERITGIKIELEQLRDMFEALWLETNLPANLEYNLNDYNRLISAWEKAQKQILSGNFDLNPVTPAQWIYHPVAYEENKLTPHCRFQKTFNINQEVESAGMQLIGDTHVKLFVNGNFLGEQYARKDLVPKDDQMIGIYNIKKFLQKGENSVVVEAHNYMSGTRFREPTGPHGNAGIHLYGEISLKDKRTIELISDSEWMVSFISDKSSQSESFNENAVNAVPDESPFWIVTYPFFETKSRGFVNRK